MRRRSEAYSYAAKREGADAAAGQLVFPRAKNILNGRLPASALALCLLVSAGFLPPNAHAQDPADRYFGLVHAVCGTKDCADIVKLLNDMGPNCSTADAPCKEGYELLNRIFGRNQRPALPSLIVYLDQQKQPGKLTVHEPRLMWREKNTPYLYGVRDVYVLAFSEKRVCADAYFTTELKTDPNPLPLIIGGLGGSLSGAPAAPQSTQQAAAKASPLRWFPLSGFKDETPLWLGFASGRVDENSVNRVVLGFNPRPNPEKATTTESTVVQRTPGAETVTHEKTYEGGKLTKETSKTEKPPAQTSTHTIKAEGEMREECVGPQPAGFGGNATAANAFFSNSSSSFVGLSVALAVTTNASDSSIASGRDQAYNGYFLLKGYLQRPRLRADLPEHNLYGRSYALVLGTGISHAFDELLLGASIGHIWGHTGLIAGLNSMKPAEGGNRGRRWHPFIGIEYSF